MNFPKAAPAVVRAMLTQDAAAKKNLDPILVELVEIRSSQLNHCAYCLSMHTRNARKAGETEERIYQLNAWEEAGLFTEKEQAALALTEAVTVLTDGFVPDGVYERAAKYFDEP